MKKVLIFAGSNHSKSIHHSLITFTSSLLQNAEVTLLDIRDWEIPIYSIDMDPDQTPPQINTLIETIQRHDGFILASPEHNGGTPAFLKNILDWLSRRSKAVFKDKPMLLLSTSPGKGGGATNLGFLANTLPYQGAKIISKYSLPSFHEAYQNGTIVGPSLAPLKENVTQFLDALNA